MYKTIIISLCIAIIFAVLMEANSSGCEWSGCKEFAGASCKTGVTGGSGRHNRYNDRRCGFRGRKNYCCADDCRYVECGVNVIGGTRYTDSVPNQRCGVPSQQAFKEFVCGGHTGDITYESLTASGFRSIGEENGNNGGFRVESRGSGFRSTGEGRIDGSRSENGGFRNSYNGGFRTK